MRYILEPAQDAPLPAEPVKICGVAYNDGAGPIESVLISFDRGQSWTPAEITRPDSPYAWYQWTITADIQQGTHERWSRAVDALGRSQPLDGRSEERRVGQECVRTCRSLRAP